MDNMSIKELYQKDVKNFAIDFLLNTEQEIIKGIANIKRNPDEIIDGDKILEQLLTNNEINNSFIETVNKQINCTMYDIPHILEYAKNIEFADTSMIRTDPIDYILETAQKSFIADVHSKVASLIEDLIEKYDDECDTFLKYNDYAEKLDDTNFDFDAQGKDSIAEDAFMNTIVLNNSVTPLDEPDEHYEYIILNKWLQYAQNVPDDWARQSFGEVKLNINENLGMGYSVPEIKRFVLFDQFTRQKLPNYVGMKKEQIENKIKNLESKILNF